MVSSNSFFKMIYEIFQFYNSKNAKLWNIGTNIKNSWENLNKNFSNFKELKDYIKFDKLYIELQKKQVNNQNRYKIYLLNEDNEKIYLSFSNNKKVFSKSAIQQFIKIGMAADIIQNQTIIFEDRSYLYLNLKFKQICLISEENFDWEFANLISLILQKSFILESNDIINLGLSIFSCYLFKNLNITDFLAYSKDSDDLIFTQIKKSIKKYKSKSLDFTGYKVNSLDFWDFVNNQINDKNTYKGTTEVLNKSFVFIDFVEHIYLSLTKNSIDYIVQKNEDIEIKKIIDEIELKRHNLRKNIIKKINNYSKYNFLENTTPKKWYIEDCDACHILEVWQIKEIASIKYKENRGKNITNELNKIISYADNPNNGILLPLHWHNLFDKNLFSFDHNGYLMINKGLENSRFEILNIDDTRNCNIKIKNEFLDDEMRFFINERNKWNNFKY